MLSFRQCACFGFFVILWFLVVKAHMCYQFGWKSGGKRDPIVVLNALALSLERELGRN